MGEHEEVLVEGGIGGAVGEEDAERGGVRWCFGGLEEHGDLVGGGVGGHGYVLLPGVSWGIDVLSFGGAAMLSSKGQKE